MTYDIPNKISIYIKNIHYMLITKYSMIKMYMYIFMIRLINYILMTLGYTRIYDLDTGEDLTIFYHIIKLLPIMNLPVIFDVTYQKLGVCTYINEKYVRYICYNTKLLNVLKKENEISSKNYHSIVKIELVFFNSVELGVKVPHKSEECPEKLINRIDITGSKNQFYDVGNFTRPYDVIRFYHVINNVLKTYESYDKYMQENIKSISIHREFFDIDLVEYIKTCEEIDIETFLCDD